MSLQEQYHSQWKQARTRIEMAGEAYRAKTIEEVEAQEPKKEPIPVVSSALHALLELQDQKFLESMAQY